MAVAAPKSYFCHAVSMVREIFKLLGIHVAMMRLSSEQVVVLLVFLLIVILLVDAFLPWLFPTPNPRAFAAALGVPGA